MREGGSLWRKTIIEGDAAEVEWPADLPPLTADLMMWFAWRSSGVMESWRSASHAAELYRTCAANPRFRSSLVPVLDHHFVDVEDGSVWVRYLDDDGLDCFDRTAFADLSELLASMEDGYAARRCSPWRRFRVERGDEAPWTRLDVLPGAAFLARIPVGGALLAGPATSRWPRWQLLLKLAPASWLATPFRGPLPFEDRCVDLAAEMLRERFAAGDDALKADLTDEAMADRLASMMKRWSAKGPVEFHHGVLRMWQQPPVPELLARLERALARVAPHVRRAFAPPARDADIAALEVDIGVPLPFDVRALWALADGQTASDALYWSYRLVSVADARSTIAMMLSLAAEQFGQAYWNRAFVPLLDRGNGDYLCVDVAGTYGPEGSIVAFDHEWPERRRIVFGSLTDWLECFVDGLEAGIYVADPNGGVFPHDFLETGSLNEIARHDAVRTNGLYPWELRLRLRPGSTLRSGADGPG